MNNTEILELKRKLGDIFASHRGFSSAITSALIQNQITDMLLDNYFIQPHPTDEDAKEHYAPEDSYGVQVADVMARFDGLVKTMNEWVYSGKKPVGLK